MPDGQLPAARDDDPVWLRVGTLLDGSQAAPLRDAHVVYDAGAIRYVGRTEQPPPPEVLRPSQREPDAVLDDHTLLPGLIEAHAHLFLAGSELDRAHRSAAARQPADVCLAAARTRLGRLARLGVVAVRDAGDRLGVGLALARLSRGAARPLMPDVESPGAAIHRRGRYGGFMAEPLEDHPSPRACVDARVREGADRIKLIATGVVDFARGGVTGAPQLTVEEISALVAAATEYGKPTFAHASGAEGIGRVIAGGIGSVEHGFFMGTDDLGRMRDRQIAWTPTVAPVRAQLQHADRLGLDEATVSNLRRILEAHARQITRGHDLGVAIVAGSDAGAAGVPHGDGLLDELELLEEAGLTSLAVLRAATGIPAGCLGLRARCGRIAPGYRARFIVTPHSPLAGIANLRKARQIVFDGVPYASPPAADAVGL
jgi:imidazolonepropionase-like amidohydrolase